MPKKKVQKINKQIKKAQKSGASPLEVQALKEKKRAIKGKTQTKPGENFGTAQTAGDWASENALAQAQQTSYLQSPNQTDIYGNQYQVTFDENGQPQITQSLGDTQQGMLDTYQGYQQGMMGMGTSALSDAQSAMSSPYSSMYEGLQQRMSTEDMQSERRRIEDAYYQDQERLMGGDMKQEMADFEQMAAERGWTPGSEVYEREKSRLETNQASTRQGWANQAAQAGLSEMQGQYALSSQERAAQLGERQDQRYGSLGEAQQLMGTYTGPQQGQFQQAQFGQVAPTDYAGLAANYANMSMEPYLQSQKYGYEQQMLNQQLAAQGGGGGGGTDYESRLAYEQALKDRGLAGYYDPGSSSSGSNWSGAIQGIASGIGKGIGNYLGSNNG